MEEWLAIFSKSLSPDPNVSNEANSQINQAIRESFGGLLIVLLQVLNDVNQQDNIKIIACSILGSKILRYRTRDQLLKVRDNFQKIKEEDFQIIFSTLKKVISEGIKNNNEGISNFCGYIYGEIMGIFSKRPGLIDDGFLIISNYLNDQSLYPKGTIGALRSIEETFELINFDNEISKTLFKPFSEPILNQLLFFIAQPVGAISVEVKHETSKCLSSIIQHIPEIFKQPALIERFINIIPNSLAAPDLNLFQNLHYIMSKIIDINTYEHMKHFMNQILSYLNNTLTMVSPTDPEDYKYTYFRFWYDVASFEIRKKRDYEKKCLNNLNNNNNLNNLNNLNNNNQNLEFHSFVEDISEEFLFPSIRNEIVNIEPTNVESFTVELIDKRKDLEILIEDFDIDNTSLLCELLQKIFYLTPEKTFQKLSGMSLSLISGELIPNSCPAISGGFLILSSLYSISNNFSIFDSNFEFITASFRAISSALSCNNLRIKSASLIAFTSLLRTYPQVMYYPVPKPDNPTSLDPLLTWPGLFQLKDALLPPLNQNTMIIYEQMNNLIWTAINCFSGNKWIQRHIVSSPLNQNMGIIQAYAFSLISNLINNQSLIESTFEILNKLIEDVKFVQEVFTEIQTIFSQCIVNLNATFTHLQQMVQQNTSREQREPLIILSSSLLGTLTAIFKKFSNQNCFDVPPVFNILFQILQNGLSVNEALGCLSSLIRSCPQTFPAEFDGRVFELCQVFYEKESPEMIKGISLVYTSMFNCIGPLDPTRTHKYVNSIFQKTLQVLQKSENQYSETKFIETIPYLLYILSGIIDSLNDIQSKMNFDETLDSLRKAFLSVLDHYVDYPISTNKGEERQFSLNLISALAEGFRGYGKLFHKKGGENEEEEDKVLYKFMGKIKKEIGYELIPEDIHRIIFSVLEIFINNTSPHCLSIMKKLFIKYELNYLIENTELKQQASILKTKIEI